MGSKFTGLRRRFMVVNLASWAMFAVLMFAATAPAADPVAPVGAPTTAPAPIVAEVKIEVDAFGNARVRVDVRNLKMTSYADMEFTKTPEFQRRILHLTKLDRTYYQPLNFNVSRQADISGVRVDYELRGFARPCGGGSWEVPVLVDMGGKKPGINQNTVAFRNPDATTLFAVNALQLTVPNEARGLRVREDQRSVTFEMPAPQDPQGDVSKADFQLDGRPRLMACLAKSYGYEKFPQLWVARANLTNSGTTMVSEYSVRYRLVGYSADWSDWHRYSSIMPSQTIVDAYFPILDVDKLAALEGTRQAQLQAEYTYKTGDGKVVSDSVKQTIQILGHNEVILGENCEDLALASLVTRDDPVVRRIAGLIVQQVPGGFDPSDGYSGAYRFAEQLYRFMLHNKIAYQTPPSLDGVQHVKYCRDVILDRAGTCVDLAIFYASVCEAVGLHAVLYLPPGHCFPGIRVMGRDVNGKPMAIETIAIETTMLRPTLTFFDAASEGYEKSQKLEHSPTPNLIDIAAMRTLGVDSMELPPVAPTVLETLGITSAPPAKRIQGSWHGEWQDNGRVLGMDAQFSSPKAGSRYEIADGILEFRGVEPSILSGGRGACVFDGTNFCCQAMKPAPAQDAAGQPPKAEFDLNERARITWTDDDHFVWKYFVSAKHPNIAGSEIHFTRQNRQLDFNADQVAFVPDSGDAPAPVNPLSKPERPPHVPPPIPPHPQPQVSAPTAIAKLSAIEARDDSGALSWRVRVNLHLENAKDVPCEVVIRCTDASGTPIRRQGKPIEETQRVTPLFDKADTNAMNFFIPYGSIPHTTRLVSYIVEVRRSSDGVVISTPQTGKFIVPANRR